MLHFFPSMIWTLARSFAFFVGHHWKLIGSTVFDKHIIGYTKILCLLCTGDLHVGQVSWICGAHISQRITWPQGNKTWEEGFCKQTQHICKEGISPLLAPLFPRKSSTCWSFTSTTSCPPSAFVGSTTKRLLRVPSSKVLTPCKTERGCWVIEPAGLCKIWR